MVLHADGSVTSQIAAGLEGRGGLNAVHVMTHGAPGRVNFSTGPWTVGTLEDEADDLAAVGEVFRPDGDLLLWSCHVGKGVRGRHFVDELSRATGASVSAAAHLIGAPALGGCWDLGERSDGDEVLPPLTKDGLAKYAGVLINDYIKIEYPTSTSPNRYHIVANIGGNQTIIGNFTVPKGSFAGSIAVSVNVLGPFTVADSGAAMSRPGSIALYTESAEGSISYDPATTSILGAAGTHHHNNNTRCWLAPRFRQWLIGKACHVRKRAMLRDVSRNQGDDWSPSV